MHLDKTNTVILHTYHLNHDLKQKAPIATEVVARAATEAATVVGKVVEIVVRVVVRRHRMKLF
tara:strand:- start:649 stop:837 length:189 start_codon:yes stop_codon:yes gene_type:complete